MLSRAFKGLSHSSKCNVITILPFKNYSVASPLIEKYNDHVISERLITNDMIRQINLQGTYYEPASKHYGVGKTNVMCDRCHKNNLDCCIGLDKCDLCMQCVSEIRNISHRNPGPVTKMLQRQFWS